MTNKKPILYIFILAAAVRIIYLINMIESPYFGAPFLDELYHVNWANEIAHNSFFGNEVFFRAPLYSYTLGIIFMIFGNDLFIPIFLQHLLGAATAVLIFLASKKIFPPAIASTAGVLAAIYPPLIFNENQFFDTSLVIFLSAASLFALMHYLEKPAAKRILIAGLIQGVCAITRPNILLFSFCLPILIAFSYKTLFGSDKNKTALHIAIFLAGVIIPIIPVTIRNAAVGKTFVPISTYGGINFYIGNNPNADGFTARTSKHYQFTGRYRDSVQLFAEKEAQRLAGKELSSAEIQAFWKKKAMEFIRDNPVDEVKLLLKKTVIFFSSVEVKNNKNIYFVAKYSFLLKFLLTIFHFGILLPLAAAGIATALLRKGEDKRLCFFALLLYLATQAISVIIFFVSDRHRLPFVIALFPFAAFALFSLIALRHETQKIKAGAPLLIVLTIIVIISNIDWFGIKIKDLSRDYWSVGNCYRDKGDYDKALDSYMSGLKFNDKDPDIYNNIGEMYYNKKDLNKALEYFNDALNVDSSYIRAMNNLGVVYEESGNYNEAEKFYRRVLSLEPEHDLCRANLGDALLKSGRTQEALEQYLTALQRNKNFLQALIGAAKSHLLLGNDEQAKVFLARAIEAGGEKLKEQLIKDPAFEKLLR